MNPKPTYLNPDPARAGPDRSYLCAEAGEEVTYAAAPEGALWEVVNYLELSPEIDYAAPDYDPTLERPALIDELLQWGAEQEERRLALASKLKWEPYKHVEDLSTLTDMQEAERVACERCGCYSSERFELLMERCRGRPPNRPAAVVVRRLASGLHTRFLAAAASAQLLPVRPCDAGSAAGDVRPGDAVSVA